MLKFGDVVRVKSDSFDGFYSDKIGVVVDSRNNVVSIKFPIQMGTHMFMHDKQIAVEHLEVLKFDSKAPEEEEGTEDTPEDIDD